ncbi:acetoacetate--CoA ligase [Streptomyces thinghirensis]|uniref:Acetoacetate--CoA ligase n=1 Tax=Streptomyces thinghirensis TaxID=551547 RepID=A0ABP9T8F6_9ACTN
MSHAAPAKVLRPVPADARDGTVMGDYMNWLERQHRLSFEDYDDLYRWSVEKLEEFWQSIWDFFEVRSHAPHSDVLADASMPGATWFPGATLNWAEHALRPHGDPDGLALIERTQTRAPQDTTRARLADLVARARAGLQRLGVQEGDRVVAYLPNITETAVAYLATISLGAVWASCAPEFGHRAVVDRFAQIEPKVLLVVPGYVYGDKHVDRRAEVEAIRDGLPTVEHVVCVPYGGDGVADSVAWDSLVATPGPLEFAAVPFDHPMVVLFTSGTTGRPKPIVHGHGGLLLEQLKSQGLMWDLRVDDRLLWFSTTAWMLWNIVVSALLHGSAAVLVDGNPLHPDLTEQWRLAEEVGATLVGLSPGYAMACRKAGIRPTELFDLSAVRQIGCAGAPLAPSGFEWIVEQFGQYVLLNVGSGGTDVCTGIVSASPLQPVYAGEMSGNVLGVDAASLDPDGRPVVGELGELVITQPMPSMPVGFWGDRDGARYREAYFDMYPGVWRMGDWARYSDSGSVVITGRSDATLNRGGVRIGTADLYSAVEELPEISDSLVVHLEDPDGGPGELTLYVVPSGADLDDALRARIRSSIRAELSPRHVPDRIRAVEAIPRGRTGKKLEVPVKRILLGADPDTVASRDSLLDPDALTPFVREAAERR